MAKIEKPVDKKAVEKVTEIAPPDKKVSPLQLPIGATDKADYKAYAANKSKTMPALFLEMFEFYKQHHD